MHVFPGVWRLWASLPGTARAFLLLTAVQAFLAGIFAATQIGTSLQDTLLILATSLSLWWLSLDSLLRACAHQLPACAVLGTLGVAEMVAFAVAHGADSPGPTAVAALCAALQLAALALCRTAYRQVGWRWAGRMPGDGRLRGTELRKRAALCRSRLGAAARFDAVVLAILSVVMVTEGAPLAGSGAGVALLVGGALGGALLATWNAAATLGALRRHARLALAADFAFPLSYGPPVIGLGVVVAGGPGPAAAARLAVACVVFLAARATLWWAVRLTWRATRALRAEGVEDAPRAPRPPLALLPLMDGEWMEKESRRRPGLTTSVFMQLSEDGSTLRWGWSSSVLLYHVESVRADDPARSLTLTFALGAPLTLRLGGAAAYVAWRTGLAELLPRLAAHADLLTGDDAEAGGTESAGVQKHRLSIKRESSELEGCINIHVLTSPVGSPRWDGDGDAAGHARRRSLAAALEAASGEARGWALPAWMRGVGYLASGTVPGGGAKRRSSPTKQPLVGGTSLSSQSSVGPRDDPELGAGAWEGGRGRGLEAVLGHPGLHRRGGASSAAGSTPTSEVGAPSLAAAWAVASGGGGEGGAARAPGDRGAGEARGDAGDEHGSRGGDGEGRLAPLRDGQRADEPEDRQLPRSPLGPGAASAPAPHAHRRSFSFHWQALAGGGAGGAPATQPRSPGAAAWPAPRRAAPPPSPHAGTAPGSPADATAVAALWELPPLPPGGGARLVRGGSAQPGALGRRASGASLSPRRSLGADPANLVRYEDLRFGRLLGEGSQGAVYAGRLAETPVAVKRVAAAGGELDAHIHATTPGHDNVVALRGWCVHAGSVYLVMELCARGTLAGLVHAGGGGAGGGSGGAGGGSGGAGGGSGGEAADGAASGPAASRCAAPDAARLLPLVRGMARGLLHLHTRTPPLQHRDIKLSNVLLGPGGVPKLADFGMSVLVGAPEAGQRHVIGTAAYAAPELLEQGPPAAGVAALKADVYSFGVAVWEALARRRPHQGLDGYQIQTRWMLDPEAMRLPGPGRGRAELGPAAALLWDLVADCTAMDPAARPDMLAVLERLRAGTGQSPPQPHTPLVNPI
ncbi:hypothetical protein ACKKBG_A04630 [Auxenochlorella protothecoides x Auxenochlorella symbiontica]